MSTEKKVLRVLFVMIQPKQPGSYRFGNKYTVSYRVWGFKIKALRIL